MNEYSIDHIKNLRIHELRDFARTVGVPSPTTMKKEELIKKINNLLDGERETLKAYKNGKGDDSIDFFSLLSSPNAKLINDLIAKSIRKDVGKDTSSNTIIVKKKPVVSGDTNLYYPTDKFYGVNLSLKQDYADYDSAYDICVGYLDIHPSGYGIIRKNGFIPDSRDVYLANPWVSKHNLKKGQLVEGKVKEIINNKPGVMYEITSIDGFKEAKRVKSFDDYGYNGIGDKLSLDKFKLNVKKGSRIYIKNATLEDCIKLGYDIVDENSARVKLINAKARPEEHYQSQQKLEVVNCPFNKTEVEIVNAVELVVERIKRELEYGNSNVLIIYNFSEMIRTFNVAVEGFYEFQKFNAKAINKISNILYSAKNVNDKLNTTIICMDKNGIPEDIKPIMNSEYMPVFNEVLDELV